MCSTGRINIIMRAEEFVDEWKASPRVCRSRKKLSASADSSCKSQGLRARTSVGKGHTDGKGNYIKGKKVKGAAYGGPVKSYW